MTGGAILLSKCLLRRMQEERSSHLPLETGGFLLGLRRGLHIEITEATLEGPQDRSTRRSFERRDPGHAKLAVAAWEAGDGKVGLVGDWHSHPVGSPMPSAADRGAWLTLAQNLKSAAVGIILADSQAPGVFLSQPRRLVMRPFQLKLVEETRDELVYARRDQAPFLVG